MTLSDISIKNPVFAWMIMAALILFGIIAFTRLGISQMPDVNFPVITVTITLPDASPSVMEADVSDIVENACMGVQGVDEVDSVCTEGNAQITVDLHSDRSVDAAFQDVSAAVEAAEKQLPANIDPPIIQKFNPNSEPILWLSVYTDPSIPERDLMLYVRDHLEDYFESLPGVGNLFLGGYVDRNIRIWVNDKALAEHQLTAQDIINTFANQDVETDGGIVQGNQSQYDIRTMGGVYHVSSFGEIPIIARGPQPNYLYTPLKDVATIQDGLAPITRISRYDGKSAVGLGIVMQSGANAVEVANEAYKEMAKVKKLLPPGFHMGVSFDATTFIRESIHELEFTLILSALLTGLVCYLFLGSWSSTINVFLAIPTSILGTFFVIYFCGFTLNTFTLMALSLSVGIVVDDAIMVLENIVRHRERGEDQVTGALKGAREITFAAIATSLAIIAIFLPVAFMSGVIGKFFFQFGVTIAITVLLSLLEAITLTPMRCSQFLEIDTKEEEAKKHNFHHFIAIQFDRLARIYHRVLEWCLNNRWKTIIASTMIFIISLGLIHFIGKEFVPAEDQSIVLFNLKTPVYYSLLNTNRVTLKCEHFLEKRGEVKHIYAAVGGFAGTSTDTAFIFVTLKPPNQRPLTLAPMYSDAKKYKNRPLPLVRRRLSQQDFEQMCRLAMPKLAKHLRVTTISLSMRGWSAHAEYPIDIMIQGPSWSLMAKKVPEIEAAMRKSGDLTNVDTDYIAGEPEIRVIPNRKEAAEHGVSMGDIGQDVEALMGGLKIGEFDQNGHQNDIYMRLIPKDRLQPSDLKKIYIRNNRGYMVPLSEVSAYKKVLTLQQITRIDRQRTIQIFAGPAPGVTQQVALKKALAIARKIMPTNYTVQLTGAAQENQAALGQLLFAMVLGIVVAYMILASQFNSFIHPFTVLLALPFSITGALITLWLTGQTINLYSIIGIILLLGLVKKNSIMLVDFTNQVRAHGKNVKEALLTACPIRLRPILMTTAATIAGALPSVINIGPGSELRKPMAVVVIGGMIASTLLTLLVVPCVYSLFSKWERTPPHSFESQEEVDTWNIAPKTPEPPKI
jgi:HAE1 family hydrophobic/amphiphilic exporter-1